MPARKRRSRMSVHAARHGVALLQSQFVAQLARLRSSTGEFKEDPASLKARKSLMARYGKKRAHFARYFQGTNPFRPGRFVFPPLGRPTPVPACNTLWLDNYAFMKYAEVGFVDAGEIPGKAAWGEAGSVAVTSATTVPLHRISFGFRTTHPLPASNNQVGIHSRARIDPSWLEAQSFRSDSIGSVLIEHQLVVKCGAMELEQIRTVLSFASPPNGGTFPSTEAHDSVLAINFFRPTPSPTPAIVDEALIITCEQRPDGDHCVAVVTLSATFHPLYVHHCATRSNTPVIVF